jgi:S-adenosylmethionine synthetase
LTVLKAHRPLLWGGAARPWFGGGEVLAPIDLYLAGRATAAVDDVRVPLEEIAVQAARAWLGRELRYLDPMEHVRIRPLIRPTSTDLAVLFKRRGDTPLANDSSFGVGFAPLDLLERTVLAVEHELNLPKTKKAHPHIGEDIKVMGVRAGEAIHLTVACALVARHVASLDRYHAQKAQIAKLATAAAQAAGAAEVHVMVNPADGASADSLYLTVTGTSAEAGDDGQVGRGNRANGLITPYRPMSLEATAGKNPVTHTGKLYNVIARRIAAAAVHKVPGVLEAQCFLISQIGQPINQPQLADLKVRLAKPQRVGAVRTRCAQIVRDQLGEIRSLWQETVDGRITLW